MVRDYVNAAFNKTAHAQPALQAIRNASSARDVTDAAQDFESYMAELEMMCIGTTIGDANKSRLRFEANRAIRMVNEAMKEGYLRVDPSNAELLFSENKLSLINIQTATQ